MGTFWLSRGETVTEGNSQETWRIN
jgi:hypothetical protein